MINAGLVEVNNKTAKIGDKAEVSDQVKIEGREIDLKRFAEDEIKVLLLNKEAGFVCSKNDEKGRKSVFDLLPDGSRWVMVGRLDINTSGLLLFTNNGDLAHKLMHPRYEIEREYMVRVRGQVSPAEIKKLTSGVRLDDGMANFDRVEAGGGSGVNRWYKVVLKEGRNREVRRLWEALDFQVSRLIRVRFGTVSLPQSIRANKFQLLRPHEVKTLINCV